jgi:regulator of replication initiation timing
VIFTFTISFFSQKRSATFEKNKGLAAEVRQFNDGKFIPADQSAQVRLDQFENTITSINKALSNQQKVIEKFHEENNTYNQEINKLKNQLRELHKDYDIVVSENFSLRAKFKSLAKKLGPEAELTFSLPQTMHFNKREPEAFISSHTSQPKPGYEISMSVFDETKVVSSNNLDDTHEIDVFELLK